MKTKVFKGKLDKTLKAFPDQILVYVADEIGDALRFIIQDLRALEIENSVYPNLEKGDLPAIYLPLVASIEHGINTGHLPSVNVFGQVEKYKDPIGVHEFLSTFGWANLKTNAPYEHILSDYVEEEIT